jgi:hypothetical protein
MPIHFICPHCGAATDIDERLAGMTGPCAHCGKSITIPIPGGVSVVPSNGRIRKLLSGVALVLGIIVLGVGATVEWLWPAAAPLLWPANPAGREAALRLSCVHNLQQIAAAMKQYDVVYGSFPPAFIADKNGKPMHSWRVLILPYLGLQDVYDRYRFDEPWDSVRNRAVTDLPIELFQCPGQPHAADLTTNYMMVVGPHTISNGPKGTKITDITDDPPTTIMVVEVADSDVRWAEPVDLRFDKMEFAINGRKRPGISSHHPRQRPQGVNVAFCDGMVRWLKNSINDNPRRVMAMLTIDGGETVPPPEN